jgi:hypothetical protein
MRLPLSADEESVLRDLLTRCAQARREEPA